MARPGPGPLPLPSSDWIPLCNNESNNDYNHDTPQPNYLPANHRQSYYKKTECHKDDDDADLFFDTIPLLMENAILLNCHNDDNNHSMRISDNAPTNEACIIASSDEITTPTVLVKDPLLIPSSNDTFPHSQCDEESLQHPQQRPVQQLDTLTDSFGALPINSTQSILLPPPTMDYHRTIVGGMKHGNTDTDNSDAIIQEIETPPPDDKKNIPGNDDGRNFSSSESNVITLLNSSPLTTTTSIHGPKQLPPPLSQSMDDHNNPPPVNHQNNSNNRNIITVDTDGILMIQFLWTELQHRDRSCNINATASTAPDDHPDYTNHGKDDHKTRSHDDSTIRDDMLKEYPFLAIFL